MDRRLRWLALAALLAAGIGLAVYLLQPQAQPAVPGDDESPPDVEGLASLPYLSTVPSGPSRRGTSGVILNVAGKAWSGVNLFTPRPEPEALLVSMDGEILHRWRSETGQPRHEDAVILDFLEGWHHVEPLGGGRILAIVENRMVLALDAGSRVLWTANVPAHHDIAVAPSGEILTLCAKRVETSVNGSTYPLLDEEVTTLSNRGVVLRQFSLLDLLRADDRTRKLMEDLVQGRMRAYEPARIQRFAANFRRIHAAEGEAAIEEHLARLSDVLAGRYKGDETLALGVLRNTPSDIIHANSIEILADHPAGLWKRGDLLVSLRNLSIVAVVDMTGPRFSWMWGPGTLDRQHQPSALPNGDILVFDNGGDAKRSRILEVNPADGTIPWSYEGTPPGSFFSPVRGGVEALPNGDLLATDSEQGRVFEVTRDKEIVWEYLSAERPGEEGRRTAIYRMTRLSREQVMGKETP